MIKDNRQLESWPERLIISADAAPNPRWDGEPFAQEIKLECGHWLINTYGGIQMKRFEAGELMRCKLCGEK